jgi:hypothetical protein
MQTNHIMGVWKFHEKVSVDDLVALAKTWAEQEQKYTQLYVRKVSKDQYGVGFTYDVTDAENADSVYKEYFEKTSDSLKRQFGNSLVGWDISCPVWIVK